MTRHTAPAASHHDAPTASRGTYRPGGELALALARAAFVALSALSLGACAASVPSALARFSTLCTAKHVNDCPDAQATASAARALQSAGISLHAYAVYTVALMLVATVLYVGVAALIVWRRSNTWMGLFTATFLLTFGIGANGFIDTLARQAPAWAPLLNGIIALGNVSIVAFFYTFPSGRFVPRWTIVFLIAWLAQVPGIFSPALQLPEVVSGVLFLVMVLTLIVAQVYRYRRVSSAMERQQTKWVVFGAAVVAASETVLSLSILWLDLTANTSRSIYDVVGNTGFILAPLAIPLSIGVAILRYRLWDIDVLINRTLVYGSLTAVLAAVYFGSVVGMQRLAAAVAGPRAGANPLIVVASTLLIAALFSPLRRHLQRTIDRRFYRSRYDAAKTLANFGQALRQEVDLPALTGQLVVAVEETMRPAHVSLWLREPGPREG